MSLGLSALREKIQRKFALILSIQNDSDFFLEVCNYLTFILSDIRFSHIIAQIFDEKNRLHENYNKFLRETLDLLKDIRKNLQELLIQHNVEKDEIRSMFERFDKIHNGAIQTTDPIWDALEDSLYSTFSDILKKYPKVKLAKYIQRDKLGNIRLTPKNKEIIEKLKEENEQLKITKRTSIWGVFERLALLDSVVFISDKALRETLKQNFLLGMGLVPLVNEMRNITGRTPSMNSVKQLNFNKDTYLIDVRRLHNFVLDHLDKTNFGFILLRKFKEKCEWYDRENLLKLTEKPEDQQTNSVEKILTRQLALYLHDNGVIPLSQVIFGNAIPDLLGLSTGQDVFPIEVKVIRFKETKRLKIGFNQIVQYLKTVNVKEGFYVVFVRGDFTLDITNSIVLNNHRINIVTIDISKTSPSQRQSQIWTITEKELITE